MKHKHVPYKIRERRRQVQNLVARGIPEHQIAEELNISRSTVSRDKKAIRQEVEQRLTTEPIQEILYKLETQLETITHEFWRQYHSPDMKPHSRLMALHGVRSTVTDYIKVLQSLGVIRQKAPDEKIEMEVGITSEQLEKLLTGFDQAVNETVRRKLKPHS